MALTGVMACLAAEPTAKETAKPKPARPKITISKETTYITAPLRADGYPDYLAALNELSSRGVTPENNAAVPFWQAIGPKSIPAELRPQFFKLLGIKELPEKGAYFVPFNDYAEVTANMAGKEAEYTEWYEKVMRQFDEAMKAPWSAEQYPDLAAWLKANEVPLRILVEGARLPRFYSPVVVKDGESLCDADLVTAITPIRKMRELLTIRAMLHLKSGKTEEARQDLLACHRWGRLLGQRPLLIDVLLGRYLESCALEKSAILVQSANLTAKQAGKWLADLHDLAPVPKSVDCRNAGERLYSLDYVCRLARGQAKAFFSDLFRDSMPNERRVEQALLKIAADPRVDWDEVLRMTSGHIDEQVAAHRLPTHKQKCDALDRIDAEGNTAACKAADPAAVEKALGKETSSKELARHVDALLSGGWGFFHSKGSVISEDRNKTQFSLLELAFALAVYRTDHDKYPASLAELKPKYIAEIPKDLFTDKDLIYKPQDGGKGYVLYSPGPNGRDDGGVNANDDLEKYENVEFDKWPDDIAIRTSAAERAAKK